MNHYKHSLYKYKQVHSSFYRYFFLNINLPNRFYEYYMEVYSIL